MLSGAQLKARTTINKPADTNLRRLCPPMHRLTVRRRPMLSASTNLFPGRTVAFQEGDSGKARPKQTRLVYLTTPCYASGMGGGCDLCPIPSLNHPAGAAIWKAGWLPSRLETLTRPSWLAGRRGPLEP